MRPDHDPSVFEYSPATAGSGTFTTVPEIQKQQTTVNLGVAASIDFDFNADTDPIFDMFVFADRVLDVLIFLRQGAADTFRQLDGAIYASGVASVLKQLLTGVRFAGSQVRIRLINNSGVATTVLSAQVHARSM